MVHEEAEPVFLTKNGHGDMVVMGLEQYEDIRSAKRIETALHEAETLAESDHTRYDFTDVSRKLRKKLTDQTGSKNV
ncbi:type II toxin-antitoxin system Phd/YefM family antitoxin [Sporolactobacillus sp. CPB3-1]|uniref:Type II toxin-antitoxin system Phd/YefM family antitoxin n=1 Tax=Sporolactobacillus mangiferae TaxID=2940498 RepID=A0ABT0M9N9_9BACL|nr:type II toxin-antitoxin system Phd/YefM family antitoxin [Sporolactobacillus mangiferae]